MTNLLKNRILCHILILQVLLIASSNSIGELYCSEVYKLFSDQNLSLATRANFALEIALRKFDGKRVWLVYSIRSTIRDYDQNFASEMTTSNNQSLYELLFNEKPISGNNRNLTTPLNDRRNPILQKIPLGDSNNSAERYGEKKTGQATQLAIVLDYSLESGRPIIYQVYVQNISERFNQETRPIFWLGNAASDESIVWLKYLFYKSSLLKFKQQAIRAVGFHDCEKKVVEFSKKILHGKHQTPLKVEAISLAGKSNTPEGLKLLVATAINNDNTLLRKKALFALSQFPDEKALQVIAAIAKKEKQYEVRKEAIFWLGQVASVESAKILTEIMRTETDARVRECTLLAVNHLPVSLSKQLLAIVAMNDSNYRIRKKARLMLRHSGDEKLMYFFDELVKSNDSPNIEARGNYK